MKWYGLVTLNTLLAALLCSSVAVAQRDTSDAARSDRQQSDRRDTLRDDEIRLRYDDDRDRLQIDVEEDVQFRNDQRDGEDRGWARDGEFDVRYDTNRGDLRLTGDMGRCS